MNTDNLNTDPKNASTNKPGLLDLLLADTYTLPQLLRRISLLRKYLSSRLFKGDMKISEVTIKEDLEWFNNLNPEIFTQFTPQNHGEIINTLLKQVDTLKTLIIYLPFEIQNDEIPKLGKYLRSSYGKNFLYETRLDPGLLGGCALVWNGIYKDYSLRARIDNNKDKIIQSLKSFKE